MWFSPWRRILRGRSGDAKPSGLRAGTKFVEEDTGIEYTYDPVMQNWKKRTAPYSALVAKDGSTVWAEDANGKTIASGEAGVGDASVILNTINELIEKAKKGEIIKVGPGYKTEPVVIRFAPGKYKITQTIEIKNGALASEIGTSANADIPITLSGGQRFDVIFEYNCNPCILHDLPWDGAAQSSLNICGITFTDSTYSNDALHIYRWSGYLKDVFVIGSKRALVIEMGWGKGTGIINSQFNGNPDADEGVIHIIPARWDNTNNISFIDVGISTKSVDTPGYALKWDDNKGHDTYFIDVYTGDYVGAGVYLRAKGELKFIRCSLVKVDDDQGGANTYIGCGIGGNSRIYGVSQLNCMLDSCEFYCRKTEGQIVISGACVNNCQFSAETIIGSSRVSNCHFMPERDSQDFIVRFVGAGEVSNIYIRDRCPATNTHIPCTHAMEVGSPDQEWTISYLFDTIRIECRKAKIGIRRYLGGSDNYPCIIRHAYITLNNDLDYDASEVYAIYNDGVFLIVEDLEVTRRDYVGNLANSYSKLKIRDVVWSREVSPTMRSNNSGTATFSGDGTTTDFEIGAHGLVITDPSKIAVKVTPVSSDAIAASPCVGYVDPADNTKIRVKFSSAPASGSENVKIVWYAEVIS